MEKINLKKLNEVYSKEKYHVWNLKSFSALEILDSQFVVNSFGKVLEYQNFIQIES